MAWLLHSCDAESTVSSHEVDPPASIRFGRPPTSTPHSRPGARRFEVCRKGLIEAAEAVGEAAKPVIGTVKAIPAFLAL
jgi:hypothetical protein